MVSQTAVWAEILSILHSFSRGIRFWHSRGLVPTKNVVKHILATKWPPRQPFGLRICQPYIVFREESVSGTPEAWFRPKSYEKIQNLFFLKIGPSKKNEDPEGQGNPQIVPKTGLQLIQDVAKTTPIFFHVRIWSTIGQSAIQETK